MKRRVLMVTAFALALSAFSALAGGGNAQKVQYCSWCHGVSGQGFVPAPRLAGQQAEYIENQLQGFRQHTRPSSFMWGAVKSLDVLDTRDVATYFSAIAPEAADDGDKVAASAGKTIYRRGIPALNIVACAACHGPNAQGIGKIPRLGGLSAFYLKTRLDQWAHGNLAAAPAPMPQIARQLSPSDIDALASYLSFVK
ncbi:MAG: cytochrome c4 [Rhodanobacter sp.]|nr:MAG: cytochrome c4 [Rhodanobacter sp.]TAM42366.1 MAG: cytochrome c4 [Rhodanobacter sp.]